MIYGVLADWQRDKQYFPAVFDRAFAFLADKDIATLAAGRHPLDGDAIFASVERLRTQDEQVRRFEAHQRYLDIQLLLAGREKHRYAPDLHGMTLVEDHLRERDLAFYSPPTSHSSLFLEPGHYAVYFPGEPHSPCCAVTEGGEEIHKIVFKIRWPA